MTHPVEPTTCDKCKQPTTGKEVMGSLSTGEFVRIVTLNRPCGHITSAEWPAGADGPLAE